MYDPSMRVLTVLELLQTRERMSGADLTSRLEVSVRTVQRYVARLQDLGVPVTSTRGPGGSYRLKPGFRLPPMMFGTEEAFALVLGLDALTHLGLGDVAPATSGAKAKLERVLPAAVSERTQALRAALALEKPRWVVDADAPTLTQLATAVHARQRVALRYEARDKRATSREVEPWGVMQHEGRWFLAGYCFLRASRRLFRVDRIKGVERLAETFEKPLDFDLRAFVRRSLAATSQRWRVEVWLAGPPEALEGRIPWGGAVLEPEAGGTRLWGGASDLDEFAVLLLHLGCRIEVREPAALAGAFRRVAERALAAARTVEAQGVGAPPTQTPPA